MANSNVKIEIDKIHKRLGRLQKAALRAAAEAIAEDLVLSASVNKDTGLAMNNWQVGVNGAPTNNLSFSDLGVKNPGTYPRGEQPGLSEEDAFIRATDFGFFKAGDEIEWNNNIPEGHAENGLKDLAGLTEVVVIDATRAAKAAARKTK